MGCCKSKQKDEDDKASILPSQSSTNVNVKTQEPEPEVDYAKWTPEECTLTLDPEHPLGDIFLTVHHIVTDNELVVRLRRARHLDHVSETANPYFELSLFPDPNKEYLLKSEVKRGTFDPVVDDLFRFPKITEEEFSQKVLRIVAHDELRSPTYIGEVVIELSKMGYDLLNPRWVPLRKGNGLYPPLPVSEGPSVLETPPSPSTSPKNGLLSFVPGLSNLPSLPSLPSMPGMPNMPNMPSMPSIPHLSIPGRSKHDKHDDTFSVAQSVMSSMSNTSTAALVKDIEYGKVHLSLYLDPLKRVLKVVVISARLNKTSSPDASVYVKLKMIPDPANKSKQKTKTHKGMEPVFNDSFEFQLEKADERRLQVTVWEEERMGHNVFRGECIIALTGVDSHEPSAQWHVLHSQAHGELLCRLSYDLQTDYLSVTVIKGRDLISSKGGAIDPYTKIYLLPDKKKKSKKKTRCRKHTTNPEFNETVQYFLAEFEEGRQRVLHVSVLNHNSVGNNDVIGSFSVGIREIMESQAMEQWFPLIKEKAGPGHFA